MKPLSIALLLVGAIASAHAADIRSEIISSSNKIAAVMKKKDFAALSKLMKAHTTSDFKYVEGGKAQTFDQMMENMKMGLGMMSKITVCKTKLLTLQQNGDKATSTMQHSMTGTMMGQDKKSHTMSFTGVSQDTYVKQGGVWKMSSMTWKSMKQMMDGKPMPMGGG